MAGRPWGKEELTTTGERVSLLTPHCGLGTHNKDITSTKYDDETSNKPMQFGRGRLAGRAAQGDSYNSLTVVRSSTVLYESTKKTGDAGYEDPIQRKEKARPRAILSMQASQSQPEPAVKSSRVSHARIMCDRGNSPQGPRACVNLTVAGWHRGVAYSVDGISVRSTSYSTINTPSAIRQRRLRGQDQSWRWRWGRAQPLKLYYSSTKYCPCQSARLGMQFIHTE